MRSKPKSAASSGIGSENRRAIDSADAGQDAPGRQGPKAGRKRSQRDGGADDARARAVTGAGEGVALDQATRDLIKRAILSELTLAERLLLVLRYAEGMTLAEVASTMQIPVDEAARSLERIVGRIGTSVAVA